MKLADMTIYPVKSFAGISLSKKGNGCRKACTRWAFTAMLTFALAAGVEMGDVLAGFSTGARIRAKCMSLVESEGYTSACQFRHFGYHVKRVHC
jgi:hypothetical protein